MNEEELKKEIELVNVWFNDNWDNVKIFENMIKKANDLFSNKNTLESYREYLNAKLEGFQKGKLEAIEDELRFLKEIEKGTSCIDTKMFLKLRIEQLQKEIKISGDSLTEFWDNPEDDRWDREEEKQNE